MVHASFMEFRYKEWRVAATQHRKTMAHSISVYAWERLLIEITMALPN